MSNTDSTPSPTPEALPGPAPSDKSFFTTAVAALGRFFLMRDAMVQARSRHLAESAPGFSEYVAAKRCLDAVESLGSPARSEIEGLVLLRSSLSLSLSAVQAQSGGERDLTCQQLWEDFSAKPEGLTLCKNLTAAEQASIKDAAGPNWLSELAAAGQESRARLSKGLGPVVESLVDRLNSDAQSIISVHAQRLARCVGLPVVLILLTGATIWLATPTPVNLALNKAVQQSSFFRPDLYPMPRLVDGDKETLAIHTDEQDRPWAQVDLGAEVNVGRVVVTNRSDHQDRAIPLEISTSVNGKDFTLFGRKDKEFLTWTAQATPTRARYVRLTVARNSALHVAELEVYSK